MNITLIRLLTGLLLLAVPALMLWKLDRRFLRRAGRVVARTAIALGVLAVCLYYVFLWNIAWVNVLWALLASCVSASVLGRKRWLVVPLCVGVSVSSLVIGALVLWMVMGVAHSFDARWLVPMTALLQADALWVSRNGLRAYAYCRRTHWQMHEFLVGNGAKPFEAVKPFVTKAVTSALSPVLPRLAAIGLGGIPVLLCGVLMGGIPPLQGVALLAVALCAMLCCSALSLALTLLVFEKLKN